jgi:hypothetical protein
MNCRKHRLFTRLIYGVTALCLLVAASASSLQGQNSNTTNFPQYDHIFLVIMENENYNQIIGNAYAPILNTLAQDYGLATRYTGVADPSEPNYVAMLGGDFFGINSDDPYWFPGQTVSAANLMSQLEGVGKNWRGYFQSMPYAGYRGYCFPDKCNGIPDADTQYVSKHNGIVNFANLQSPTEFANMFPLSQLSADLAGGTVSSFSYIVPNECTDMHGAPPWCVDSDKTGTVQQSWLIAQGDKFVGNLVNEITSSSAWRTSRNSAIVITFDEGNTANSEIVTIVITNHGPRGVTDNTSYNHYSLLASLQQTFGLGCLLNSCAATPMTPLFAITGSTSIPSLPSPYNFPTSSDSTSAQGAGRPAGPVSLNGSGWSVQPSYSFGPRDNILAGVSAASTTDAWAVGAYYPSTSSVLATLGQHFDGSRWTAYPLPNVGVQENCLLGVSMPSPGKAWAVGYYVNGKFQQQTLVEYFDGNVWSVVPSPSPGALQNILYGVAAISTSDVWAVGADEDSIGLWHTLAEHWDGSNWSVIDSVDAGSSGNQFYAVTALNSNNVYAVGQQSGNGFPNEALIEHWNGKGWSVVSGPTDPFASALPLGVAATPSTLTVVGQQETDLAPYTTYVVAGAPPKLSIAGTPNAGYGENDLFAAAIGADGTTWAAGWDIDTATGNHDPLVLQGVNGSWSLAFTPSLGAGSDSGFAAITAIPGGGFWAVGQTASAKGNYSTLIEWHP